MQYICLVYQDEGQLASMPDSAMEEVVGDCVAYIAELERSGHHIFSAGLQARSAGALLRPANSGLSITDGPFAETKEYLGGFTIVEARDLNEAIHIASKLPLGPGSVEVRPLLDPQAEPDHPLDRRICACMRAAARVLS